MKHLASELVINLPMFAFFAIVICGIALRGATRVNVLIATHARGDRRMGLFDTVIFVCPGCGHELGVQTKAMPNPYLDHYSPDDPPMAIVADLLFGDDDAERLLVDCSHCGRTYRIVSDPPLPARAKLRLEPVGGS